MQEPHGEGLVSHTGPESCGGGPPGHEGAMMGGESICPQNCQAWECYACEPDNIPIIFPPGESANRILMRSMPAPELGCPSTGEQGNWQDMPSVLEYSYVIERALFVSDDWRDHDGDDIYADWTVDFATGEPVMNRRYLAGVSFADVPLPQEGPAYSHGDHLGTTRRLSQDAAEPPVRQSIYTAFGELKYSAGSLTTRYGYVGASGYEESPAGGPADVEFIHVGARWYDPSTGRFLQRDSIGIEGGVNVYAFAQNNPLASVDPVGLIRLGPPCPTGFHDKGMFDWPWSQIHYGCGYVAGKYGFTFSRTMYLAIKYEFWERDHWPGFEENLRNTFGDIIAAGMGWIDAEIMDPLTERINQSGTALKDIRGKVKGLIPRRR